MRRLAIAQSEVWRRGGTPLPTVLVLLMSLVIAPPALSAVDHDAILRDRLNDVRERLDRRQAHRSMLTGKIERFSGQLDRLQAERETALQALADQEDRALLYERELDRLMPRLLPRLALLDRFRKDGARAIAGLASMERNTELKDRTRSRLVATRAPSIEQMRRASTALRLLRRVPSALAARHRDIDFQIPLLAASVSRLDLRQSQLQRRRDSAIRELADLTVDIDRLTAEEHRLARNVIARSLEATDRVDVAPGSLRAALPNRRGIGKASVAAADIRGVALRRTQPTPVARPWSGLSAGIGPATAAAARPSGAALSSKSEPPALVARWASRQKSWRSGADGDGTYSAAIRGVAGADRGPALIPSIETIGFAATRGGRANDLPQIAIAARPLQRVAAPHEGNVAFAGVFRSYGLLLIIERGNGYHTLLWGFSSLDVELGDTVQAGQIVGVLKDGPSPSLNVELRRNGQPVSPEVWLAASISGVKG